MKEVLHKYTTARMIDLSRYIEKICSTKRYQTLMFSDFSQILAKGNLNLSPALHTCSYSIRTTKSLKTDLFWYVSSRGQPWRKEMNWYFSTLNLLSNSLQILLRIEWGRYASLDIASLISLLNETLCCQKRKWLVFKYAKSNRSWKR